MAGSGVTLPYHAIFDILSRTPVKSVSRFRCASKGWRDLISSPVFAAAHRLRHGPLLVDSGCFPEEEPAGGRDMRLMDTDGNVLKVIKGVGGYGMMCTTSLDDLICVNGACCDGIHVVDPATGEVLATCPQVDIVEHDTFPYAATRYYSIFGFGRAAPSADYKLVRYVATDCTVEVLTLGDDRGWRKTHEPPLEHLNFSWGSPVAIDGVMFFLQKHKSYAYHDNLRRFDLESERWMPDVIYGPLKTVGEKKWNETIAIRITKLNGAFCMVQMVADRCYWNAEPSVFPSTNIWILQDPIKSSWIKAYTITMAPYVCRYMPLRVMHDGKLLLQCSLDYGPSLVLQIYDPRTDTCAQIIGTPEDLAGRIGLCNLRLGSRVSAKDSLAHFVDQALFFLSVNKQGEAMKI